MSEENNMYENNNQESQYTQAPENNYVNSDPYVNNAYSNDMYSTTQNYDSGKGQGKGLGIASMICGIASLLGCCGLWYIGVPAALVAIILGIIQCVKNESKGMAIAGIICGAIGLILTVLVVIGVVALVSSGAYQELMNEAGMYY